MAKRKFYVIGHNPNILEEAESFLQAGANALAPDIKFENGNYYVSHGGPGSNPLIPEHSLINYLTGLRELITATATKFNLGLLLFDIKDPVFDINEFLQLVHEHFSKFPVCTGVAIMVTTADLEDVAFLNNYDQSISNVGIGVDQCDDPAAVLKAFDNAGQRHIAYADGITTLLHKPGVFYSTSEAKFLQKQSDGFKMVFTWVLKREASMRDYLGLFVDGIFVDMEEATVLLKVLSEPEFASHFELAVNGYNPWNPVLPTVYCLEVKTCDRLFAGTDSHIRFILSGTDGKLEAIINTSYKGMMESGGVNHFTMEGDDISRIMGLKIRLMDTGIGSAWLPEQILVQSQHEKILFKYKKDEWLSTTRPVIAKQLDTLI